MESRSRRDFLKAVIGGTTAFSLTSGGFAQQPSASIAATRLSENMVLLTGAGRNVLAVNGPDGILMVNGGRPEQSADLLKAVAAQSSSNNRVQALFNTDWYPENTGSNEALGKAAPKSSRTRTRSCGSARISMWNGKNGPISPGQHRRFRIRRFTPRER